MTAKPELAEVAPEGWPVLAAAGIVTILLAFLALPLAGVALGLMVWLRHILRIPVRKLPADAEHHILAPADGVVLSIGAPGSKDGDVLTRLVRITIKTRLSDAQLQ